MINLGNRKPDMTIKAGSMLAALSYLSAFAGKRSVVHLTPCGEFTRFSLSGDGCFGEYLAACTLSERFSVMFRTLHEVSLSVGDCDVHYYHNHTADFVAGGGHWRMPYSSVEECRPEVNAERSIVLPPSFSRVLNLMKACTKHSDDRGSLNFVRIEESGGRRAAMATDGHILTVYDEDVPVTDKDFGYLLISRRDVSIIERTCDSGRKIEIRAGVYNYSVTCGRRQAVFPIVTGQFPNWSKVFRELKTVPVVGTAYVPRLDLHIAMRQTRDMATSVLVTSQHNGLKVDDGDGEAEVILDVPYTGSIGPVRISSSYLRASSEAWPFDDAVVQYRGRKHPLVLSLESDVVGGPIRLKSAIMPISLEGPNVNDGQSS